MYREHPKFKKPENEDVKIWRFLDFIKFFYLLDKRALYFSRADRLGDPFEGVYSQATFEKNKELSILPEIQDPNVLKEVLVSSAPKLKTHIIVNSWHKNQHEPGIWDLYLKNGEGVAIQSTFRKLADSFGTDSLPEIYIGEIEYLDYTTQPMDVGNFYYPYMHKRKVYEHERELRAVIFIPPTINEQGLVDWSDEVVKDGKCIPIDPDILIERVILPPNLSRWRESTIKSLVRRFGFDKPIKRSLLEEKP